MEDYCTLKYNIDILEMDDYKFSEYFEKEVLRKRPYLKKEWCIDVIKKPLKIEPQEHNRFRFWGVIAELEGRVLRVVTLEDKKTMKNPVAETAGYPNVRNCFFIFAR